MTVFYSREGSLRDSTGGSRSPVVLSSGPMYARRVRVLARRAWRRLGGTLNIIHQAIVTAKTRRLARELMTHSGSRHDGLLAPDGLESHDQNMDAAQFPQRPLIIGDKWDF